MDREYIIIAVGLTISVIGWFFKREINRIDQQILNLKDRIRDKELDYVANETRDQERWRWIERNMEDRRLDIRKLFDMIQELVCKRKK